jgi:hypothetical protein
MQYLVNSVNNLFKKIPFQNNSWVAFEHFEWGARAAKEEV